jgi:predicted transposase/invertase (TIGR01784 family)
VEQKAQYDEACKKILAEKIILAWIMKHTMKEYADYDIKEIVEKFIVGDPKVAETKVMPDETNAPKIIGTGVEDVTVTEGSVTYDIQFRAIVPLSEEVVQMIINIEAQNDFYPRYPIIKRAVYYCTRMISSQYGTVFTKSHYEKVQKVYSVWICMNPPKERKNTITEYSLTEKHHVGKVKEKEEYYDLVSVVMICLGTSEDSIENELLRMLDVLLSSDKKAIEKKKILENEFQIPMTEEMKEEVECMCNLSDGVENKGIQKGIKIGIEKEHLRIIQKKIEKNKSVEQIAEDLELTVDDVEKYIQLLDA